MWVPMGIPVSTHKDLSLAIPVGTHWPMGFWPTAPGDPWERIFTDLGAKFSAQIPVGTDPGHPRVHSCPALVWGHQRSLQQLPNLLVSTVWPVPLHIQFCTLHPNQRLWAHGSSPARTSDMPQPSAAIFPALRMSTHIFKLSQQLCLRPVSITHLPSFLAIWAAAFPMVRTLGNPGMVHWILSSRKAQRISRSSWLEGTMAYLHSTGFFFI